MIDRTYAEDVTAAQDGEELSVAGHVHDVRDLGGLLFVILRDGTGRIQLVFKEDDDADLFAAAEDLSREDVVHVTGIVQAADQAPGGAELAPTPPDQ